MMSRSVAILLVVVVLLAGCTDSNPDKKPVYFDFEHAGVPA
jgi:hypothetical protein